MDSAASISEPKSPERIRLSERPEVVLSPEEREALMAQPAPMTWQPEDVAPRAADEPRALAPDELEIRLKAEQARQIVEDVIGLRRATSIEPGQTPMLDILVNTLVIEYGQLTGTIIVIEAERRAKR